MRLRVFIVAVALVACIAALLEIPEHDPLMCREARRHPQAENGPVTERTDTGTRYLFSADVDAVSFRMPDQSINADVRGWNGTAWTAWEGLEIENEFDPLLTESNLVMLPRGTRIVELRSPVAMDIHPITVSRDPVAYQTASHWLTQRPKILKRGEWGADEKLLVKGPDTTRSDNTANTEDKENVAPSPIAKRVIDCKQMQRDYPQEFKTVRTVRTTPDGEKLRWPIQYSPAIKLLVVHHTALAVGGDTRPATERIRALYAYHANSRGWGDIGYNYVIDESGQIYEGRTGGPAVVAGHAYCHNIGSIGISLLGHFETEKPTQDQISALQWLLQSLSRTYDIDVSQDVTFHGNTNPAIVGHGDLVSTTCPGFYMREVLDQVRRNVQTGKTTAHVTFPQPSLKYKDGTDSRKAQRLASQPVAPKATEGVTPMGSPILRGRPGSQTAVSIRYQAGDTPRRASDAVAQIRRSQDDIGVWQEKGGEFVRLRDAVVLNEPVPARGTTLLRLKIQFPADAGRSTLTLGGITYVLETEGRRQRGATPLEPMTSAASSADHRPVRPTRTVMSASSSSRPKLMRTTPATADDGPIVRIRLSFADQIGELAVPPDATVNGTGVDTGALRFTRDNDACVVSENGRIIGSGIVRIDPRGGISALTSWQRAANRFRGLLECRVVENQLVFINELPLEQYLRGLAEEPDTEPYEKQRAFAIAARTYALFYILAEGPNRKFPGKPYDGSDDPAIFQKYGGVDFEEKHPRWLDAVESTRLVVLTVGGHVIKPPYFSSDSGRTKSPAEAGWRTFPFAEVFVSKPDPWCEGMKPAGHGVGMSGCGAEAQANEGKSAEQILEYYYTGAKRERWKS